MRTWFLRAPCGHPQLRSGVGIRGIIRRVIESPGWTIVANPPTPGINFNRSHNKKPDSRESGLRSGQPKRTEHPKSIRSLRSQRSARWFVWLQSAQTEAYP